MNYRTRYLSLPEKVGRGAVLALWVVFYLALYGCGVPDDSERAAEARKSEMQVRAAVAQKRVATPPVTPVQREEPRDAPVAPAEPETTDGRVVTFDEAYDAYKNEEYTDAVTLFDRYVRENPANPWGHYMVGLSQWKAGALEEAERAFEKTLELDPSHVKSLLNLSRVLLDADRPEDALEQVDAALDIEPMSGDGLRLLGRALYAVGDVSGAIDAYEEAVMVDDVDGWSMNNLGLIFIEQGRHDDVLLPLARATQVRTDVPAFFNNLGIALERTGRFVASAEAYRRVIALDETYAKAMVNLSRVDGREDDPSAEVVDLTVLAERFLANIEQRRQMAITASLPEPETIDTAVVPQPEIEADAPDSVTADSVHGTVTTPEKKEGNGTR